MSLCLYPALAIALMPFSTSEYTASRPSFTSSMAPGVFASVATSLLSVHVASSASSVMSPAISCALNTKPPSFETPLAKHLATTFSDSTLRATWQASLLD